MRWETVGIAAKASGVSRITVGKIYNLIRRRLLDFAMYESDETYSNRRYDMENDEEEGQRWYDEEAYRAKLAHALGRYRGIDPAHAHLYEAEAVFRVNHPDAAFWCRCNIGSTEKAMDVREKEVASQSKLRGRNPDWSREETVLLMQLYLSAPKAEKAHPEVVAFSVILRATGRRDGRAVLPSFRNPAGIAMRLRNFAKHDPNAPAVRNVGLRPGGAIDQIVWEEFAGDRAALEAEAGRIRRSISGDDWQSQKQSQKRSSRGKLKGTMPSKKHESEQ